MSNYFKSVAMKSKIKDKILDNQENNIKNNEIIRKKIEEEVEKIRFEDAKKYSEEESIRMQKEEALRIQRESEEIKRQQEEIKRQEEERLRREEEARIYKEEEYHRQLHARAQELFNIELNKKLAVEIEKNNENELIKKQIEFHKVDLDEAKKKELEAKIQAEEAKRQLDDLKMYYEEQINKNLKLINKFKGVDGLKKKELEDLIQRAKEAEISAKNDADELAKKAEELSDKVIELMKKEKEDNINKKIIKNENDINNNLTELKNLKYYDIKNNNKIKDFDIHINEINKEIANNLACQKEFISLKENKLKIRQDSEDLEKEILNKLSLQIIEIETKIEQTNNFIGQLEDSLKTLKDVEESLKNDEGIFKKESNDKIKKFTENIEKKSFIILDLEKKSNEYLKLYSDARLKLENYIKDSECIAIKLNQLVDLNDKIKQMEELSENANKIKELHKYTDETNKTYNNFKKLLEDEIKSKIDFENDKKNFEYNFIVEQENYNNKIKKAEEMTNNTELLLIKTNIDFQELLKGLDKLSNKKEEEQLKIYENVKVWDKYLEEIKLEEDIINSNIENNYKILQKYSFELNILNEQSNFLGKKIVETNNNLIKFNNYVYDLCLEYTDLIEDKLVFFQNKVCKYEEQKNELITSIENNKNSFITLDEAYKKTQIENKEILDKKANYNIHLEEYLELEKDYINNINNLADKIIKFNNLFDKINVINNINNTIKQAEIIYNKKVDTEKGIEEYCEIICNQEDFLTTSEKNLKDIQSTINKNELNLLNLSNAIVTFTKSKSNEISKKEVIDMKIITHNNLLTVIKNILELNTVPDNIELDNKLILDSNNIIDDELQHIFDQIKYHNFDDHLMYNPKDDLLNHIKLNKNTIELNRILNNPNKINIDLNLFKYCNKYYENNNIITKILNDFVNDGYIYSFNQIENLFDKKFLYYIKDDKIYLEYNNKLYDTIDVVNYIYSLKYDYFINDIKLVTNNLTVNSNTMYCCYLGSYDNGVKLVEKVSIRSTKMFCFIVRSKKLYDELLPIIQIKFSNYIIFINKEYGSDIIPTLQALSYIVSNYNIKYIYKFHTKGDTKMFNDLTDYLLSLSEEEIKNQLDYSVSNCVTKNDYYKSIKQDVFNKKLIKEHLSVINHNLSFGVATIFYCEIQTITKVLEFIKNNDYRQYFTNNLYDTNIVLFKNSPVHFIERLFGIIKL